MRIKHAPPGRNAYWFEDAVEHETLHLGAFAETLEKNLEIYADLLARLYLDNPSLWVEFQSNKTVVVESTSEGFQALIGSTCLRRRIVSRIRAERER